jgi:hypothetical protein
MGANKDPKRALYMRRYRHGLSTMKAALARLRTRRLDMRFGVNKAIVQWRNNLVRDLGGLMRLALSKQ